MTRAMFRRTAFHDPKLREHKPKWHRLQSKRVRVELKKSSYSRTEYKEYTAIVTALCGYEYKYSRIFHGENGTGLLEWRDEIKTARLRCAKCDKAWEQSQTKSEMV